MTKYTKDLKIIFWDALVPGQKLAKITKVLKKCWEGGVENPEKMLMSLMGGPLLLILLCKCPNKTNKQ